MRGEIWGRQHRTQPARGSRLRSLPDSLALFPLPRRSVLRRHFAPSLFLNSLVDSTPDLCCCLQTFFLYLFFPLPVSLFLFGVDSPKTRKQLTAAFSASSASCRSFAHRRGDVTRVLTPFGRNLGESSISRPLLILGLYFFSHPRPAVLVSQPNALSTGCLEFNGKDTRWLAGPSRSGPGAGGHRRGGRRPQLSAPGALRSSPCRSAPAPGCPGLLSPGAALPHFPAGEARGLVSRGVVSLGFC